MVFCDEAFYQEKELIKEGKFLQLERRLNDRRDFFRLSQWKRLLKYYENPDFISPESENEVISFVVRSYEVGV